MTLKEAIEHLKEILRSPTHDWSCAECKEEHSQLLAWLLELQSFRAQQETEERKDSMTAEALQEIECKPPMPRADTLDEPVTTREKILDAAKERVCGDRDNRYGEPENNFALIAKLWSDYKDIEISPTDVCMMMALLKIARIRNGKNTRDSFVDLAGYAACGGELAGIFGESEKKKDV